MKMSTKEVMQQFLHEDPNTDKNISPYDTHICVRFARKKFKCFVIYALMLIAFFEMAVIILEKVDSTTLSKVYEKLMQYNNSSFLVD